jgi:hypothetical protein
LGLLFIIRRSGGGEDRWNLGWLKRVFMVVGYFIFGQISYTWCVEVGCILFLVKFPQRGFYVVLVLFMLNTIKSFFNLIPC